MARKSPPSVTDHAADLEVYQPQALVRRVLDEAQPEPHVLQRAFRAATSMLLERVLWLRQAGITFRGQRDSYELLGYNRILTARMYRDRYVRGGLAARIVDVYPNATWRGDMEIIESPDETIYTTFEQAWVDLEKRLKIKTVLLRVDKLSRLGAYAVLLIGAPGDPSTELPRVRGPQDLWYLTPFSGGGGPGIGIGVSRQVGDVDTDATIREFETDPGNPRFGLARFYQLRRLDIISPELKRPIHWSRIIHIAEGRLDNEVYGQPALERCWNLLDDLDKVTGGGAEAFWLRASGGVHMDIDKTMELEPDEREKLKKQGEEYQHNILRMLTTRGVTVNRLGSDVANFNPPADAILTQIAGTLGIPKRILIGSEMGEMASTQDRDNWVDQINGRQQTYADPYIVRNLLGRLIAYNFLPTPEKGPDAYEVRWPHIQNLTEEEKMKGAQAWAAVNRTAGMTVFTEDEIRDKWYQMAPIDKDEQQQDDYRAALSLKLAMSNKTQGEVVYTNAEIRKIAYGFAPLPPDQIVPIGAPEKISVTKAPGSGEDIPGTPRGGVGGSDANGGVNALDALARVTTRRQLEALERAIDRKDVVTVHRMIGLVVPYTAAQQTTVETMTNSGADVAVIVKATGLDEPTVRMIADRQRQQNEHNAQPYSALDTSSQRLQKAALPSTPRPSGI
jgi:uncharacterized protein